MLETQARPRRTTPLWKQKLEGHMDKTINWQAQLHKCKDLKQGLEPAGFSMWEEPACEWPDTDFTPSLFHMCHSRKQQQTTNSRHSYIAW